MSVLNKGRMLTAAVTIAIAIGAGHIMQYRLSDSAEFQQPAPRPSSLRPQAPRGATTDLMIYSPLLPPPAGASRNNGLPADPAAAIEPISFPAGPLEPLDVPPDTSGLADGDTLARSGAFGTICQVEATAEAGRGAVISLDVDACERDVPLTVSHAGLVFSAATGRDGRFSADIPAFEPDATVEVSVAGQPPITLKAAVPDAIWYDRVALVWDGSAPLSIHALELGAGPGSAGHVSAAHPRGPERAESAEGGFLVSLGEPALGEATLAEIYSFPSGRFTRQGTVRLAVSAEVTRATCNRTLPVRILQSTGGTALRESAVPLAFPDCKAVGDILVLKNLLQDLKIARN
jgi:hypothetical protein